MQYLPPAQRERAAAAIARAGARADESAPLAWLMLEPTGEEPEVRLQTWPGGEQRLLATAGFHGAPVGWSAAMVVTIDGPAGAGKSTVARALAERWASPTWTRARCTAASALAAASGDASPRRWPRDLRIELGERVRLDGRDVTEAIRTPEVSEAASRVAADPEVRRALVAKQRELLARGDWVAEGRDIGTVVAPDAEVKVFLDAEPGGARAPARATSSAPTPATVLAEQARARRARPHASRQPAAAGGRRGRPSTRRASASRRS